MTEAVQPPRGRHVLAELRGVSPAVLDDAPRLSAALRSALGAAGAQVRQVVSEAFTPHGVTVVAVLAESHASVHTWPEHGQAFVDVFTCGDSADPEAAARLLGDALGAAETVCRVIDRGAGATNAATVSELLSPGLRRQWELGEVHWQGDTGYQRVLITDTAHGVTLFCDDERQSAEHTQLVYHEALFVSAALLADRLDSVLVIGSSEGVVSQLAVAAGAAVVNHVDIDAECVRACARHLPYGYTVEELAAAERGDGAVRMNYADGVAFVEDAGERRWDVIVVDLPDERPDDPAAQHNRLYGAAFLRRCAELLTPGGVLVSQAGCPTLWRNDTLRTAWRRFCSVFGSVAYHGSDEHEWAFLVGRRDSLADPTRQMLRRLDDLRYRPVSIDAASLAAAATAPRSLRQP